MLNKATDQHRWTQIKMNDIYRHKKLTEKIINSFATVYSEQQRIYLIISPKVEIKISNNLFKSVAKNRR